MGSFSVSAIGRDRPGIVAAISRVLLDVGGNIEDSQMSILGGHFTVMLIVAGDGIDRDDLQARLAKVRDELGLEAVAVSPVDELHDAAVRPTHVLSVYGADHPGIVHAISTALAERDVSITDLETRVAGEGASPLYVMLMEIAAGGTDMDELRSALEAIGERESLDVSLRELASEAL